MKQPQHRISKSLRLQRQPLTQHVRWNVIDINRFIGTRKCICALCAQGLTHFVVLIGNRKFGRELTHTVYRTIQTLSLPSILRVVVLFIQRINLLQQWLLLFPVQRTVTICALEQHVLQVMRQSSIGCRVILRSRFHRHHRIHTGRFFLVGCNQCKPIGKRIIPHIQWIIGVTGYRPLRRFRHIETTYHVLRLNKQNAKQKPHQTEILLHKAQK